MNYTQGSRGTDGPHARSSHLVDIVDGASGPEMVLRSGGRRSIKPGSGLDILLMFPAHRRLKAFIKLMRFLKLRPGHMPKAMDAVRKRSGVRLGPIGVAS